MEKTFDQLLEDVLASQEQLKLRVHDLWRETTAVIGGHPHTCRALGLEWIAEKLWCRMQLEPGCCQDRCGGPNGEVARSLHAIAANASIVRDIGFEGFDLDGLKITVFVVRCFNAAMALTQCPRCAAALVWDLVNEEALKELIAGVSQDLQTV
jgi:hypothetical protein